MPNSIFVSSTFVDLERHRQLVREAISKLEIDSKAMEVLAHSLTHLKRNASVSFAHPTRILESFPCDTDI